MEQFSWWAVFLGVICPSGNYVGDKSSGRQFSLGTTSRGILSECSYFWSNCPGAILRGQSSRGNYLEGNCPRGQLSGWNFLRGQLSLRAIVWGGAIIQRQIIRGADFLVSNCPDTISNQISCRKKQISILYIRFRGFFFFYAGKQYIKTPIKISIKVQRIIRKFCRMSI